MQMMQISKEELTRLQAYLATQRQPEPEVMPTARPLITQQEFLAACVLASLLLFFILGN